MNLRTAAISLVALMGASTCAKAQDIKQTELFARVYSAMNSVPAISTHDHLQAVGQLPGKIKTDRGVGMTLQSVWSQSYYSWINPLSAWPASGNFHDWWQHAQHDFGDARATSVYRYMLPALRDLYGVDFDTITEEQAGKLNEAIFDNYRDARWVEEVVTKRANIEVMFIDPFWARLQVERNYKFAAPVLNVSRLMEASHPSRCRNPLDGPYHYAQAWNMKTDTFDDFIGVVDEIFKRAVAADAICLKSTQAYERSLSYESVPKERAALAYGKRPEDVAPGEQRDFEDFMFWHVCRLSAKHDLPFQVHTGQARIQGSNPMLLVDVIAKNPNTKFILFHGGYPWVGETGVIAMRHKNVWIDSTWLPTLSYTTAKRAYQEWLEAVPSNRILWGADSTLPEGIYGATVFTRQCIAEALAEKVQRGELREEHAIRIGRQIMRDNALALFPRLRRMLWREAE
jgi:uncharacterized protein